MPRKTRSPLASHDANVVETTRPAAKDAVKAPLTNKVHGKEEATLATVADAPAPPPSQAEVDRLRAQVDELTALLEAATIGGSSTTTTTGGDTTAVDVKPTVLLPADEDKPYVTSISNALSVVGLPPKRPQTTFNRFAADKRDEVVKAHPDGIGFAQVNAKLADMWKQATPAEKERYESELAADRERYEVEKTAYDGRVALAKEQEQALNWMKEKQVQEKAMELYRAHITEKADKLKKKDEQKVSSSDEVSKKKPKKPLNAFHCYMKMRHAEYNNSKETGSTAGDDGSAETKKKPENFMGEIADDWARLQKSRAKKALKVVRECEAAVAQDKVRYERELREYDELLRQRAQQEKEENERLCQQALGQYRKHREEEVEIASLKQIKAEQVKQIKAEKAAVRAAKKAEKAEKNKGPKRPGNAYSFYMAEMAKDGDVRSKTAANNLNLMAVVAEMWKTTSQEQKRKYQDMAAADKERYEREVAEMKKNEAVQVVEK